MRLEYQACRRRSRTCSTANLAQLHIYGSALTWFVKDIFATVDHCEVVPLQGYSAMRTSDVNCRLPQVIVGQFAQCPGLP